MSQTAYASAAFGRLLMGVLFLLSGIGKLAAPLATQGFIASVGLPLPVAAYGLATAIEIGGGLALVLGFQTKRVAVAVAIFTVATAIFFHANFADQNQMIHFLKNIAIAGGLLQVAAFGGGRFSIDGWRSRQTETTVAAQAQTA